MTDSERIKSVLDHLKMTVAKLARELGYANATKIYNVTQGLNGISVELAKDITDKYREINYEWLKEDKGSMLINETIKVKEDYGTFTDLVMVPKLVLDVLSSQQRTIENLSEILKKKIDDR
ncbi:MAG: hypothetical protein KGZ82_04475 [Bacteroidales bacterium]|nr:hypothetical protein [Bacteroidales bacterium]